ncbi:tripartite tricarboxylate transporter TctB family protein [Amaricoccus macauensis]|uniref:tripartite tricarboxylate transporter TctB family protein n=1 Tax=Amaricoccus macauensis TaxID=57001 RepID=UPI003C79C441
MRPLQSLTPETITIGVLLVASCAALVFMSSMVAEPKALFGRSLSAISPSLFPSIVLALLALLCVGGLIFAGLESLVGLKEENTALSREEWLRALVLFGIMIFYALTMVPLGFLISTTIVITLLSLQMGARSPLQIGLLATLGPILLYLGATRLLAVSLPELGVIEMAYARLLSF